MNKPRDSFAAIRRFWKSADVAPADGGFAVRLDGRTPRSPRGKALRLPTKALAELAAAEWAGAGETLEPASMPATRLAWSALDDISADRGGAAQTLVRYAGSDLLCYLAEGPEKLRRRQEAAWTPLRLWAGELLGSPFAVGEGVVHRPQPPATLEAVGALAAAADDFDLAGLAFGAPLFGSAILSLALRAGRIVAASAFSASRLDEAFQEQAWGVDPLAAQRTAALEREAAMLGAWFAALRPDGAAPEGAA
ncbi:MAG TPA: ATP12 family protein [Caulobacteraceae bacterium]|nr:ATP12 family protein [Caulobacteraceae bacterium]